MNTYQITYNGNASRFKGRTEKVRANSEKEAVHKFYEKFLEYNYWPQDDGSVKDCNGITIAEPSEDTINFDGGYFYAELI